MSKGGSGSNTIDAETQRKLFVGGLNYSTTDETLKEYFSQYGELTDCVVMKFRDTKRSRGFGFVTYKEVGMVDEVQNNRPHTIDGSKVETKRATPREEVREGGGTPSVKKVFLGGLKDGVSDDDLRQYFSDFGTITMVEQMTDKNTGRKRGFGFVEFDDYDPVDKLMFIREHIVNGYRVDVKKAIAKSEMGPGQQGGGRGGDRGGQRGGRQNPAPWNKGAGGGGYGGGYNDGWGGRGNRGGGGGYGNHGGNDYGNQDPWGGQGGGNSWGNQGNGGWGGSSGWGGNSGWQGSQGGWGDDGGNGGNWSGNSGWDGGNMGGGGAGGPMRQQMGRGGGGGRAAPYSVGGGSRGGGGGGGYSHGGGGGGGGGSRW